MYLLAIDDLTLADVGIGVLSPRPLVTNQSDRMSSSVRRREGSAGSVFLGGTPDPAIWSIIIQCPDHDARDAVLTVLSGDVRDEMHLLVEWPDAARTRVGIRAALLKVLENNDLDITVEFESSNSIWVAVTPIETTKTFASALDATMHVPVPGNTRAHPRITLLPTTQRSAPSALAGWRWRRRYMIQNTGDVPLFRYPVRIALGDTQPLTAAKALANGNDVRVWLDGLEQARSLVTWDSAASFAWIVVPALPDGETITYDVVYGNAAAGAPPTLTYPDLPPFILSTSDNGVWKYPVEQVVGNAGLGIWRLSTTGRPATPDYTIPGAWRPVRTILNPENDDWSYQRPWSPNTVGTSIAMFHAGRAHADNPTGLLPFRNDYDGVALYNPLPIEAIRADFSIDNEDGAGALQLLSRQSSGDDWDSFFSDDATGIAGVAVLAVDDYPLLVSARHVAMAVWPTNQWYWADNDTANSTQINLESVLEVTIDDSDLVITWVDSLEEEIYELATAIQIGGGSNRAAPYDALLIGNTRGESGAGTPRSAVALGNALSVNCGADHSHDIYDGTTLVESLSAHAVSAVTAWDDDGETAEQGSSDWLPLSPSRTRVPNGDFATSIAGWEEDDTTSGMTTVRTWDSSSLDGEVFGALKMAVTPNSAGSGAIARTLLAKLFPLNGRESVSLAATVETTNANLIPLLAVRFYDSDDEDATLASTAQGDDWTPAINTPFRISSAFRAPPNAAAYRIGAWVLTDAASATGDVFFARVTANDSDVLIHDEAIGEIDVTVAVPAEFFG